MFLFIRFSLLLCVLLSFFLSTLPTLSTYLCMYLSICLCISLYHNPSVCLSFCLSIYLHLSMNLSVYLSLHLPEQKCAMNLYRTLRKRCAQHEFFTRPCESGTRATRSARLQRNLQLTLPRCHETCTWPCESAAPAESAVAARHEACTSLCAPATKSMPHRLTLPKACKLLSRKACVSVPMGPAPNVLWDRSDRAPTRSRDQANFRPSRTCKGLHVLDISIPRHTHKHVLHVCLFSSCLLSES